MKKICFLLALAMLLCLLPACGSENETMTPSDAESAEPNPNAAVTLDTAKLTLPVGFETTVNATLVPRFESDSKVLTFSSSNKEILSVTAKGNTATLKALAEGSATVTVKSADGLLAASCDVTVVPAGADIPGDGGDKTPNPDAGITLDKTVLSLPVGATVTLNATVVTRFEDDDATPSFTCGDAKVIAIAAEGSTCRIKALAAGTTVITVKSADGLLSATCAVTVTGDDDSDKKPNPNAGITLGKSSLSMSVGESVTLQATVIPLFDGDDTTLTFESSDAKIATVDKNGKITALSAGAVAITAKSADGLLSATCTVTVKKSEPTPNPNAGITLDKNSLSLKAGGTSVLSATFIPKFDTDSKVLTFSSSNEKIATVNSGGLITAIAAGSAVITVQNADKSFSASCTVTVTEKAVDPVQLQVVDYPANKVRHIFSHCLIAYPEMGCGDPAKGNGSLDIDCLTVSEFQILLQSLYDNGFCLIDINDMYENYTENGVVKSRLKKNVQVYEGKKPLVISVDDVVYDSRKLDWGMIDRLEIQNDTIVGVKDFDGELVYSDKEIFPQLEKFIESHPDFSFKGAKCTLALTGFEGILGYRTDDQFADKYDYMAERQKAQVVVDWLKENGYNFASHSYSHSNYGTCSQSRVDRDIERWNSQVKPLIGETKVFVYPYGAFTYYGTETHNKLLKEGFTVFCGTAQTNCLWDGKHPKKKDSSGSTIATKTGSIYLERYTITGQTLRDWRDFPSMYEYCDPYVTYDHANRFIPMPAKTEE